MGIPAFPESAEDLLEPDEKIKDRLVGKIEIFENFPFYAPVEFLLLRSHLEMQCFVNERREIAAFMTCFLRNIRFDFCGEIFHIVSEYRKC